VAELSPEHWAEAENLFAHALELSTEERPAFLRRECQNPDVRREVASLLAFAGDDPLPAGLAIAAAAAAMADEVNPDERLIDTRLGPYRVESIAGYGGMGAVYRASRADQEFQQLVAIKLVRPAAESRRSQQRFRQERQILARLSHPNIARLLDGGSTPEGIPYLVMEFIEGQPITAWCESRALNLEQRLRLFLPVCEGVEAANREMVIHRDLKPANILVTAQGIPKLLDFGIAKLLDPEESDSTLTATNFLAMTPDYASPEQVRGERISAATDVYSLGLILYEILTGQKAQKMPEHTPDTVARVICHCEPTAPALLKSDLAGDLDNIIRKAIRKEPERRYQAAADLAADIVRYLQGRPVTARPDTFGYRAGKFLRRNRIALKAVAVTAAFVFGALALIYWLGAPWRPLRVSQVERLTQIGRVEIGGRIVNDGPKLYFTERTGGRWSLAQVPATGGNPVPLPLPLVNPDILDISPDRGRLLLSARRVPGEPESIWIVPTSGGPARWVGAIEAAAAVFSRDGKQISYVAGPSLFRINTDGTGTVKIADIPDEPSRLREAPAPLPDVFRFDLFKRDLRPSTLWEVAADGSRLHPLLRRQARGSGWPEGDFGGDWTAFGHYYVFRSSQAEVTSFWAVREDRGLRSLFAGPPVQIYSSPLISLQLSSSIDGKRIVFAGGQERRELVRYNPSRRQFLPFLPGVAGRNVDFSKDRTRVAYTTVPQDILWTCRADGTGRVQLTAPGIRAGRPRWSPDGKRIAFTGVQVGRPSRVYVIQADGGVPEAVGSGSSEADATWSPDGKSLLFARGQLRGENQRTGLYVLDWQTRRFEFVPGSENLLYAAWSPDPRYIAATGADAKVHLFDFTTRQWSLLATGIQLGYPLWSHDAKYIYFQDLLSGEDQPIFRVRISDRKIDKLSSARDLPQSDVTGYSLTGLDPDDQPIATVLRSNSDIYALDLDVP
jgi:hypothetical protein